MLQAFQKRAILTSAERHQKTGIENLNCAWFDTLRRSGTSTYTGSRCWGPNRPNRRRPGPRFRDTTRHQRVPRHSLRHAAGFYEPDSGTLLTHQFAMVPTREACTLDHRSKGDRLWADLRSNQPIRSVRRAA